MTGDPLAASADEMRAALAGAPEQAAALLRAGAEAGLPEAQAAYAQLLLDGRGVEADPAAALGWFRKAAAAGHVMAINMVGRCFEKGWGTAENRVEAARHYALAAGRGLDWGMYNYGSALALGAGVIRDERAAFAWFERAAGLGHAKSINFLGTFHEEGRIVPRDMGKAGDCYRLSAEGGDFRGQFNHGRLLAEAGHMAEAIAWIRRAAEAAPPAFRTRMQAYCAEAPVPALNALAGSL
jgi:uncharacterized protein